MNTTPLYNSRILKIFVEYIGKHYPHVDINAVCSLAGITTYQIEDEGHWFNQEEVDRFHDSAVKETSNENIAREAGRYAALSKAGAAVQQYAMGFITPTSVYKLMGQIYPIVSRACHIQTKSVGNNRVEIDVIPKEGVVEKPYQCENRMGTFESVTMLFSREFAKIDHPECIHKNGTRCHYIVSWEESRYALWKRILNYFALFNLILCTTIFLTASLSYTVTLPLVLASLLLVFLVYYTLQIEKKEIEVDLKTKADTAGSLLDKINTTYNSALLVQEIGQAISRILDVETLLSYVMDILSKRLDFDRGMIMLADRERNRLFYTVGYGYKPDLEEFLKTVSFNLNKPGSRGPFVIAFHSQKPFLINNLKDIEEDISDRSLEFAKLMGVQSFICVPITYEGKSEGILAVDTLSSKRQLSQSDLNLLQGIAPQIGISINNARSYQKMRESEEQFRALGENSPEIIYTLNSDGVVTYINPIAEKMVNYTTEEIIGNSLINFVKKDNVSNINKIMTRMRKHKEIIKDVSVTLIGKDGSEHPFNLSGAPNLDTNGELIGIVGSLKDLTELKKNYDILQLTLQSTIKAMSEIVESRDRYTAGHQKRVSEIACAIAEEMDLDIDSINAIRMAAIIHDIGKIYVPAEILSKPVRLDTLELNMIKTHPEVGYNILKNIEFTYPIAEIVYQHHERMDGSGYPRGLSGKEILLPARIISVADVVEAMSSHRPYRPSLGMDAALNEIASHNESLYDRDVVDACLKLFRDNKFTFKESEGWYTTEQVRI
jgi:PAS domain S-box-containing protein/putative nucleotidyltransferase with HDIG domain